MKDTPKDPIAKFWYQQGLLTGAVEMRERAAKLMEEKDHNHGYRLGKQIRALPLESDKEKS